MTAILAKARRSLKQLVRRCIALTRIHVWVDTRINPWGITTEQRCWACGAYRYHQLVDYDFETGNMMWHAGKHPARKQSPNAQREPSRLGKEL